ncbi:MAG: SDR family NAD(P)-dependent oxidoreductase [Candidatus Bathyarchaeia archaeon]
MSTIIVTGCAGFIGSHLCERLLEEGYQVVGIDNFDDYYDRNFKEKNLKTLINKRNFTFIKGDIRDKEIINRALEKRAIVIHLAARPGVRASIKSPNLYFDVNVKGTLILAEESVRKEVEQFIFTSSSSVYGAGRTPFREDSPADKPLSPYASTKRCCEILLYSISNCYSLPVTCLRLFTVYGPRVRPDMAIYKFAQAIYNQEELTLYNEGKLRRDYTYISDVVDGILLAMKKKFTYEIFNIGSGNPIEIIYLVRILEENLGKKAKIKFEPKPVGDVPVTYADLTKAKNMLGYSPKISFEEGVKLFSEWFLQLVERP